jgi:hypothetical protein
MASIEVAPASSINPRPAFARTLVEVFLRRGGILSLRVWSAITSTLLSTNPRADSWSLWGASLISYLNSLPEGIA